ncbi:cytochrome c family protein [Acidocella sp.]|uniref:c-type cytochrome n=1 Tax=Acidocella sp. TaxID=50710 RepID=UPI0026086599|nr:cytochrome c family protein [Acidocella sp.]
MSGSGKDSLLGNKIAAGLLTAGLIFWGANRIAHIFIPDDTPKTPAIAMTSLAPAAPVAAAAPAQADFGADLANADIAKGQAVVAQQCSACHTLAKGAANGVGPNLYGVVQRKAFSAPGFGYSSAVSAKAGQPWTVDSLSDWLKAPNSFAPGTAMSFAGIKNDQTRADVIAYLNKNSDAPAKLP